MRIFIHGAAAGLGLFWLATAMHSALTDKVMTATPAAPMSASTAVITLVTFGLMAASSAISFAREVEE